ncbi:hypothetical protein ZWY2020_013444 [Hordeum vulgare]|nr:hypothetical protein ZWY2020_027854 [Hordeum vulgare]KAI5011307.1 hypothetical protein ZWY2020_013444 [Hordeum vulgare]
MARIALLTCRCVHNFVVVVVDGGGGWLGGGHDHGTLLVSTVEACVGHLAARFGAASAVALAARSVDAYAMPCHAMPAGSARLVIRRLFYSAGRRRIRPKAADVCQLRGRADACRFLNGRPARSTIGFRDEKAVAFIRERSN